MCGITGFVERGKSITSLDTIKKMTESLNKRGPDYQSYLSSKNFAIGHARLSIIDLSNNANQPLYSISKRYLISFNGEIYNYKKLQMKLSSNYNFNENSDTSTLLEYFEKFGIKQTLQDISGMFAIALIDLKLNKLFLIRDQSGEKPIYYGFINENNTFIFGSQVTSIRKHPGWVNYLDNLSLENFLNFGFIPGHHSIYKNIKKVKPGCYVEFDMKNLNIVFESKWSKDLNNFNDKINNYDLCKSNLKECLNKTIVDQSISDVPIGAHLSGGIDSSLICSILKKNNIKFESYTIGFENKDYDESNYATKIAEYLKIKNNKIIVNENDIVDSVIKLSSVYDEPFADSSQIPSCILSKYASKKVKVMLTGDGADELFGGYNRYLYSNKLLNLSNFERNIYKILLNIFFKLNNFNFSRIIFKLILENFFSNPFEKIQKLNLLLNKKDIESIYIQALSNNQNIEDNNKYISELIKSIDDNNGNISDRLMKLDFNIYLPDDILVKSDRSSMYHSLENRSPFLDKKIISLSNKIPTDYKINNKTGKVILRSILSDFIPKKLFDRPKQGFAVPLNNINDGKLKNWFKDMLNFDSINEINMVKEDLVQELNKKNHLNFLLEKRLWNFLMFQSWYKENVK